MRNEPHITKLMQLGLSSYLGYELEPDGVWGAKTQAAYDAYVAGLTIGERMEGWPDDNDHALNEFYGKPDLGLGLPPPQAIIELPYPMALAWDNHVIIERARCHPKVADSLRRILEAIWEHYGHDGISEHGLNQFGGIVNVRSARGSSPSHSLLSRHSWGIAIDLNPAKNSFVTPWLSDKLGKLGYATMPVKVIEIFEAEGWSSGARLWGRDAMHFQATKS